MRLTYLGMPYAPMTGMMLIMTPSHGWMMGWFMNWVYHEASWFIT